MKITKKTLDSISEQIRAEFDYGECALIAETAHQLLVDRGIKSSIQEGYAAFRVGEHAASTVCFSPASTYTPSGQEGAIFHTWLNVQGKILDFSVFTLAKAVEVMAQSEGRVIPAELCRDYIYASTSKASTFEQVRDGYKFAFWYKEIS